MYLQSEHKVWLATGEGPVYLEPGMANRHGLIAGATGTGKTVTLKVLAEAFSDMGVPVFLADIKGDLSGMCEAGVETKHIRRSLDSMGLENFTYSACPVRFWDVYGKRGLPVRTTISEMGPELIARLLGLNDTQAGILRIVFRVADERGLLLIDKKILVGKGEKEAYILPSMANRHGLIAGATGTGKTITLKVMAESFSDAGVPVFLADIKGDLSGMSQTGQETKHIRRSIEIGRAHV